MDKRETFNIEFDKKYIKAYRIQLDNAKSAEERAEIASRYRSEKSAFVNGCMHASDRRNYASGYCDGILDAIRFIKSNLANVPLQLYNNNEVTRTRFASMLKESLI